MARLRQPDGCPWDRAQDHRSLREYLLEETHEVLEALDAGCDRKLAEELGDLLLQIVFHAQIGADRGAFDLDTVCQSISDKLVSRHPHVFGDLAPIDAADGVPEVWEARKRTEAGHAERDSQMDGVPRGLPALARSLKLQRRAARVGFDWPDQEARLDKIREELAELTEARATATPELVADEFGDLLFMVVNVGRGLELNAEDCLRAANAKFERRFRAMEQAAGGSARLAALPLADQDALWAEAKAEEPSA